MRFQTHVQPFLLVINTGLYHTAERTIEGNLNDSPQQRTVQQVEARLTGLRTRAVTGTVNFAHVTTTVSSCGLMARSFVIANLTTENSQHRDNK